MLASLLAKNVLGVPFGTALKIGAALLVAGTLVYGNWRIGSLKEANEELTRAVTIAKLETTVATSALSIVSNRLVAKANEAKELSDKLEAIDHADESTNGTVAPVLRDTLDKL